MSHQQLGHREMGPGFKIPSETPEKRRISLVTPGCKVIIFMLNSDVHEIFPAHKC